MRIFAIICLFSLFSTFLNAQGKSEGDKAPPFDIKGYLSEKYIDTVVIYQLDNSKLQVVGVQNKAATYTETIDGYTIILNELGFYEYAKNNKGGDLVLSGVFATSPELREKKEIKYLKKHSKHIRYTGDKLYFLIARNKTFFRETPKELKKLIEEAKPKE